MLGNRRPHRSGPTAVNAQNSSSRECSFISVNSGPLLRLWQKESSLHDSLLPPLGHSGRIMNKQISPFSNITGVIRRDY